MTHPQAFSPAPSIEAGTRRVVRIAVAVPAGVSALGTLVGTSGSLPQGLGATREAYAAAGFNGAAASTFVLPGPDGVVRIAVGIGDPGTLDPATLRNAGAAFARAASSHARIALEVPSGADVGPLVEGVLLARYRYDVLRSSASATAIEELTVVVAEAGAGAAGVAASRADGVSGCHDARPGPGQHAPQPPDRHAPRRRSPSPWARPAGLEVEVVEHGRRSWRWASVACWASTGQRRAAGDDQADATRPTGGAAARRAVTWRSSARGSCTTRAASPSSPATRSTPR